MINEAPQQGQAQNLGADDQDISSTNLNVTQRVVVYLSLNDIIQLFYPYVEMKSIFKRILPSHSYLNYFMLNYDNLFNKESGNCGQNDGTLVGPKKPFSRFFGRKSNKKPKENKN